MPSRMFGTCITSFSFASCLNPFAFLSRTRLVPRIPISTTKVPRACSRSIIAPMLANIRSRGTFCSTSLPPKQSSTTRGFSASNSPMRFNPSALVSPGTPKFWMGTPSCLLSCAGYPPSLPPNPEVRLSPKATQGPVALGGKFCRCQRPSGQSHQMRTASTSAESRIKFLREMVMRGSTPQKIRRSRQKGRPSDGSDERFLHCCCRGSRGRFNALRTRGPFAEPTAPAFGDFQHAPAQQRFQNVFRIRAVAFESEPAEHETLRVIHPPKRSSLTPCARNGREAPVVSAHQVIHRH